jgi:competence protein ComEC
LDAVRPQAVVASCGFENSYGHPSHDVIARLNQRAIAFYRTDLDGTVVFALDGARLQLLRKGKN